MATTHRIWDFRGDQVGIVWFQKEPDGSVRVLHGYVGSRRALNHYATQTRLAGRDADSIDYVRPDIHIQDIRGVSLFDAMRLHGLNPEVLPAEQWRTRTPFREAA